MPRGKASDDPSLSIIGRNLRVTRTDLKMQQGDVAARANVNPSQLSNWEKGRVKPEVDALVRVAAVYQCSLDDLVAGVHGPYDALVERGIRADAKRHYQGRLAAVEAAAQSAITATLRAVGTAPSAEAPRAGESSSPGRLPKSRARRAPKKKR